MKIYLYNKLTKEFIEERDAKKSPLDDSYLVPSNATEIAPLNQKEGYAVCFNNNSWEYVVDNRNANYYLNGEKVKFNLGDEVTNEMQSVAYTDEQLLNRKFTELRIKRNQLLAQTDYLALSDQTMTAEMTAYRQALRDITNGLSTVADIEAVVFPEKPEV